MNTIDAILTMMEIIVGLGETLRLGTTLIEHGIILASTVGLMELVLARELILGDLHRFIVFKPLRIIRWEDLRLVLID